MNQVLMVSGDILGDEHVVALLTYSATTTITQLKLKFATPPDLEL